MERKFPCPFCPLEFFEQIRLERHVVKAHKKKSRYHHRDHLWYAAGAASGYIH